MFEAAKGQLTAYKSIFMGYPTPLGAIRFRVEQLLATGRQRRSV